MGKFLIIKRIFNKFKAFIKSDYIIALYDDNAPWLYFAYLSNAFYHQNNVSIMNRHQNMMETIKMVEVFNKLGYNVYLQDFRSTKSLPKHINPEVVIIDIASNPGGVDRFAAKQKGIKLIWALSLPGKVAPISSAEFIKETIYHILEEE